MTYPTEPTWQQPSFSTAPATPPTQFSAPPQYVQVPRQVNTPLADQLRIARRWLWPIALVLAVTTGHFLTFVVIAIVVSQILKQRLHRELWQQAQPVVLSAQVGPDLR